MVNLSLASVQDMIHKTDVLMEIFAIYNNRILCVCLTAYVRMTSFKDLVEVS